MKNKLILLFALIIVLSFVNATTPHKINQNYELIINSANATSCELDWIKYPANTNTIYNIELDNISNSFYTTIDKGNFSTEGETCLGITCTDGSLNYIDEICLDVSNSGNNHNGYKWIGEIAIWLIAYLLIFFIFIHKYKIPLFNFIGYMLIMINSIIGLILIDSVIGFIFLGGSVIIFIDKLYRFLETGWH